MSQQRIYRILPDPIKDLLLLSEGWLVGSSIIRLLEDISPTDYDIIVPAEKWPAVFSYIRDKEPTFNSFGGVKIQIGDIIIDVWVESLDHFLHNVNIFTYAYNFKKNTLLKKE